jgi:hypothetical protein
MKYAQAVNMAIKALERRRHEIAIDANHRDILGADYPYAITCSLERKKINEAITLLRGNTMFARLERSER